MRSTEQMREAWGPPCRPDVIVRRLFVHGVRVEYHRDTQQAWAALAYAILASEYHIRAGETGGYNCRRITAGTGSSLHSFGIALDVNPSTNPFAEELITDMPRAMLRAVQAIRVVGGIQLFRWGGDWDWRSDTPHGSYDAMHFEVNVTPAELARGVDWNTVPMPALNPGRPALWPVCQRGDRHPVVKKLQRVLQLPQDGIFGPATEDAVRRFQASRRLKPDGEVGAGTWTALLAKLPADPLVSPVKLSAAAAP